MRDTHPCRTAMRESLVFYGFCTDGNAMDFQTVDQWSEI